MSGQDFGMNEFDYAPDRRGSHSYKWDGIGRVFGTPDLLPFWVADMDFATPQPILDAIRARVEHPVLGYEERDDDYRDAVLQWLRARHNWDVPADWLMFCPPSSIVGIYGLIVTLTAPGASIAAPTPTYGPLLRLITENGRQLIRSPLRENAGRYTLDPDDLRARLRDDTRMVLMCNPHNPTGRAFTEQELAGLIDLAARRNLVVVSDEVHCDMLMPGQRHRPIASLGYAKTVSVISPNKTFNTAGLPQATLIMPDRDMRERFQSFLNTVQLNHDSTFGSVAMMAAYRHCGSWLDDVIRYIAANHRLVADYLEARVPGVHVVPAQATYLAWLDYRALGLGEADVMRLLIGKGGVAVYAGTEFGQEGAGFLRMNVGCPRSQLEKGLDGIRRALT
jgi:cystathionine beta-lyase